MEWVPKGLGARYIVAAGPGVRDSLREAIQRLSPPPRTRRVIAHTGWRLIAGRWCFVTSSGAIGGEDIEVELGPALARYALPLSPENPREAMRRSLDLLTVASPRITVPLLGLAYPAPTACILGIDFVAWVEGQTGAKKSTLAALVLSHFGPSFDRRNLPGWSSTVNALERMAFAAKDVLLVVDDWAPGAADAREIEAKAARLIRAQGNLVGRERLRSDLSARPTYAPRGAIVATGESHPGGQSLAARLFVIEVEQDAVKLARLTEAQRHTGLLCHAMSGYISWLAPQMPGLGPIIGETFADARARAMTAHAHLRIPEAVAHLWIGYSSMLNYAEDIGACSSTEADDRRGEGWEALLKLGAAQRLLVEEERPSRRFLRALAALFAKGAAQLLPTNQAPEALGQRFDLLGWKDEAQWYLIPEAAFAAVQRFLREGGSPIVISEDRLRRELVKDKLVAASEGRTTTVARVGGRARRVLSVQLEAALASGHRRAQRPVRLPR